MAAHPASPGLALARKLGALGCPVDVRSDALEALYGNPSMRLQGFLHWFVHALDDESSLAAHFDANDRALLASMDLLDGAALAAKEREIFGSLGDVIAHDDDDDDDDDDDEGALQEEIARLERQVAMETKKQTALRATVAAKRLETSQLLDSGLDMVAEPHAPSHRVADAVDGLLQTIEQTENALRLAFLSPHVCAHLSISEDKLLDSVQAHLMPLFRRPAPSGLETIVESPTRSSSVRWLHESLVDEMDLVDDAKEREYKACNAEFHRLVAAYPRGALHFLHTKLDATARSTRYSYRQHQVTHALARGRLMDPATLIATHRGLVSANASVVEETQTLLTDMLPLRLDALGRLEMTSVVLGDYTDKIDRQTRHLADQAAILDTLERQSARLLLLSHLLKYEETQMAGLETGLGAMKETLIAEIDVLRRRLQPRRYTEAATHDTSVLLQHAQAMLGLPSNTDSLDDQCRQHAAQMDQLHTIRDTVRAEYENHLDAQLEALRLLKSARDGLELPTYSSIEALERAKSRITEGIAHASSVFQGYQNIVLHQPVATRRPHVEV